MLKNYLKIAIRNFWKNKQFTIINIIGLSVGMACVILILLWVTDELSFDRFHDNADNIYLVLHDLGNKTIGQTSTLLAQTMVSELPEIKKATNYAQLSENMSFLVQYGNKVFNESVSIADSNFFNVFSFKLAEGSPSHALTDLNSMVVTKDIAKKYFGDEKALGKILNITAFGRKWTVKISGILENIPHNSSIQCRMIVPTEWFKSLVTENFGSNFNFWDNLSVQTYVQVNKNSDIQKLPDKIKLCEIKYHPENNSSIPKYSLIPLIKIHLYGNGINFLRIAIGDIKYVRILFLVSVIILLIAGINYINLSTALSFKRVKEIGVRKHLGAEKKTLIIQFLCESLLISFIALFGTIILVELFLPQFNILSGKKLSIHPTDYDFICTALIITIVTGIVSGSYPALFLSSLEPIKAFKAKMKLSRNGMVLKKGLVIFQFTLSIIIIICTFVIAEQLSFMRNSDIGLEKENIICIKLSDEANGKYELLKNELDSHPDILSLSRSESVNSKEWGSTADVHWEGETDKDHKQFWELYTDYDLASVFKIEMSQGRYFSDKYPSDSSNAFVINNAAAKAMHLNTPLNAKIQMGKKKGTIIGVTKDFHFSTFYNAIEPLIITIPDISKQKLYYRTLSIRLKPGSINRCMTFVEQKWKEINPGSPFNFYFYDESINAQYSAEQQMGTIFKYFSFLSILFACLGLFGLVSLETEQRKKEISIRKVLGSTTANTISLLSKEFLLWVIIANLIAWPIAYYFISKWLQDFAYRINISWWIFVLSGCIALVITIVTVGFQVIKAITTNPVESLRYE